MPSKKEYSTAEENLKKNNSEFDYVITHSAPTSVQDKIAPIYEINQLTDFLEKIKSSAV